MVKKILSTIGIIILVSLLTGSWNVASSDPVINYQGRLTDPNGNPINGVYKIVFKVYEQETGGSALWLENYSAVPVSNGFFSVKLGSITSLTSVDFSKDLWLGITVESDSEMSPRLKFEDVPQALGSKDNFLVTGNVGIGTSAPEAKLHVNGTLRMSKENRIELYGPAEVIKYDSSFEAPVSGIDGILFTAHSTRSFIFGTYDGSTYSGTRMIINSAGNVGIGTTGPAAKLHVNADGLPEFTALKIGNYAEGDRQYLQIDVENSIPPDSSCDERSEIGRMVVSGDTNDTNSNRLFICMPHGTRTSPGWRSVELDGSLW